MCLFKLLIIRQALLTGDDIKINAFGIELAELWSFQTQRLSRVSIYVAASVAVIICYSHVGRQSIWVELDLQVVDVQLQNFDAAKNMTHPSRNWD